MTVCSGVVTSRKMKKVPDNVDYRKGAYMAYASPWSTFSAPANAFTRGVEYEDNIILDAEHFPNKTIIETRWPTDINPVAVWGYMSVSHGNYDGGNPTIPFDSCPVNQITVFKQDIAWRYTGSKMFGVLNEFWLTKDKRSGTQGTSGDALWEVAYLHYGDVEVQNFHNSGTFVGNFSDAGITYSVRIRDKYITAMPTNYDVFTSGQIDVKIYLDFLIAHGMISGSEWYNGVAFGMEPGKGGGETRVFIDRYKVEFARSSGIASADYLPGTTNLLSAGDDATNPAWITDDTVTVLGGQTDAEGGTTAASVKETTASGLHYLRQSVNTVSQTADYSFIHDVKIDGRDFLQMQVVNVDGTQGGKAVFNIANKTTVSKNDIGSGKVLFAHVTDLGGGFVRLFLRMRKPSGISSLIASILSMQSSSVESFVGDTTKGFITRTRGRLIQDTAIRYTLPTFAAARETTAYTIPSGFRGGVGSLTFTSTGAALPAGLSLDASIGVISGTPTTAVTRPGVVITAIDANGASLASNPFTIIVNSSTIPPPTGGLYNNTAMSDWSPVGVTRTANSVVSPATTQTALRVTDLADSSPERYVARSIPVASTAGEVVEFSVYAKRVVGAPNLVVVFYNSNYSSSRGYSVNLTTLTGSSFGYGTAYTGNNIAVVDVGSGWFKVTMRVNILQNDTVFNARVGFLNENMQDNYTGTASLQLGLL